MRHLPALALLAVGIIHLLPLSGVLGADRLAVLYGLPFDEPNLAILMRHRAVLFGLLGGMLVVAVFRAAWRPAAWLAGFVSVASFLLLAWTTGGYGPHVARVVTADIVALICLAAAAPQIFAERERGRLTRD